MTWRDYASGAATGFTIADRMILGAFLVMQVATTTAVLSQHASSSQVSSVGVLFGYEYGVFDMMMIFVFWFIAAPVIRAALAVASALAWRVAKPHLPAAVREVIG